MYLCICNKNATGPLFLHPASLSLLSLCQPVSFPFLSLHFCIQALPKWVRKESISTLKHSHQCQLSEESQSTKSANRGLFNLKMFVLQLLLVPLHPILEISFLLRQQVLLRGDTVHTLCFTGWWWWRLRRACRGGWLDVRLALGVFTASHFTWPCRTCSIGSVSKSFTDRDMCPYFIASSGRHIAPIPSLELALQAHLQMSRMPARVGCRHSEAAWLRKRTRMLCFTYVHLKFLAGAFVSKCCSKWSLRVPHQIAFKWAHRIRANQMQPLGPCTLKRYGV